jgi:hypothetical protein
LLELNFSIVDTASEFGEKWFDLVITAADFIEIDFSIRVFNKWDANEHLRKLVEVNGEDKPGGEHVKFVYNIEIEEKA